jgi:signal transduction histidine kinase
VPGAQRAGRITPLALFALPLAYCYPVQFGFLNFALGQALATLALALWIAMGRRGWIAARWVVFVPLSCALWVCHLVAWVLLGVFAGMDELARRWRPRDWAAGGWRALLWAGLRAGLATSCLVAPLVLRMVWPLPPAATGRPRISSIPRSRSPTC